MIPAVTLCAEDGIKCSERHFSTDTFVIFEALRIKLNLQEMVGFQFIPGSLTGGD